MWTPNTTRFCETFGLSIPLVQAPMAGGPTTPELVAAVSNAGGLGSLGAGYMSPDSLSRSLGRVREQTDQPFSVNLFIPPDEDPRSRISDAAKSELQQIAGELGVETFDLAPPDQPILDEQIRVVVEHQVPVVSFTFGVLSRKVIDSLKASGTRLIGTATCVNEACSIEAAGCDAVVAQGFEAGGHRGSFLDVDLLGIGLIALVPQIVDLVEIPVVASGAIMDGRGVSAALMLGASAVQLGTAFLSCSESGANSEWKECLLGADDVSTTLTKAFSGKPARGIRNNFIERMSRYEDSLPDYPIQNAITSSIRARARKSGNPEFMSLWAGQAASLSRQISAAELVTALVEETNLALAVAAKPQSPQ